MSELQTTLRKVRALKETIYDMPPYVMGVTPLLPGSTSLFFSQEGKAHCLDLLNPTDESIELLVKACDPATFGRGDQDVLDEAYRKAGKLTLDHFAINLDPARMGLTKTIQSALLSSKDEQRPIRLELYQLNVYGPGSFFKAHRDTPRGKSMFGSLVLVLPVQHTGGQLRFRRNGQKWQFDFPPILAKETKPSVGYVAFYGDIEHEVLPVESGHKVTITYNLFYEEAPVTVHHMPITESAFETALSRLLQDSSFLPDGGALGYPLEYQYPVGKYSQERIELDHIMNNLKGIDAFVRHAFDSLGLKTSIRVVFDVEDNMLPTLVLMDHLPQSIGGPDPVEDMVASYNGGVQIQSASAMLDEDPQLAEWDENTVLWLSEPDTNAINVQSAVYKSMEYGNDASLDFMYGNFCFVIEVGPFGSRSQGHSLSA